MYTHAQHIVYFLMKIKKQRKPTKKGEKKPTYPKIYTKILPRPLGFRMYAQGEEKRRTGGSIQELLLHHGACSNHPSYC
jgi:hypothetical protein